MEIEIYPPGWEREEFIRLLRCLSGCRNLWQNWKAKISQAWMSGNYSEVGVEHTDILQRCRNTLGPAWLSKLDLALQYHISFNVPLPTKPKPKAKPKPKVDTIHAIDLSEETTEMWVLLCRTLDVLVRFGNLHPKATSVELRKLTDDVVAFVNLVQGRK